MPVAVEVHHALADGLDVALYLDRLQEGLRSDSGDNSQMNEVTV